MPKKVKTKQFELPVEFNSGLQKYEPILPLRKTKGKIKIRMSWGDIVTFIIILIIIAGVLIILLKNPLS